MLINYSKHRCQVWVPGEAVVSDSGAVERVVVWQDFTQTYRLQLNPKIN